MVKNIHIIIYNHIITGALPVAFNIELGWGEGNLDMQLNTVYVRHNIL